MRLIDADELKNREIIVDYDDVEDTFDDGMLFVADLIDKSPTIDAVPVVHGEWIEQDNPGQFDFRDTWVRCSNCNYLTTTVWSHSHKYCPHCGAKMDGGADNG